MRSKGFFVLDLESTNFDFQLMAYASAETIVSSSGAAIINILMFKNESSFIEIGTYPLNWQIFVCQFLKDYKYFPMKRLLPGKIGLILDIFIVPTRQLSRIIS